MVVLDGVRHFISSRPPLILFISCLVTFSAALLTISMIIKLHGARNPDVQDWNMFISKFASLDFCLSSEGRMNRSEALHLRDELGKLRSYSTRLVMALSSENYIPAVLENSSHVVASIPASMLGFDDSSSSAVWLTFEVPANLSTTCSSRTDCREVDLSGCFTFYATEDLFPSSKAPESCSTHNETSDLQHMQVEPDSVLIRNPFWCRRDTIGRLLYSPNAGLYAFLASNDRNLAELHLMHTSYFLLVMVVTLLIASYIRHRRTPIEL